MAVVWKLHQQSAKNRLFTGESTAVEEAEIRADLAELWLKAFSEVLPWYPAEKWNSVQGSIDAYEGTIDLTPLLDFDLLTSLPGCRVHFDSLEGITQADFDSDDEFEVVYHREEERYVSFLQAAWAEARQRKLVGEFLQARTIPFRIVNSPEEDEAPLAEMGLS